MSITNLTTLKKVSKSHLRKVEDIVDHIVTSIRPSAIYLVGSTKSGTIHCDSDLDLVAVLPIERLEKNISSKVLPSRPHKEIPLDLHIFSVKEFDAKKDVGGLCFEAFNFGALKYRSSKK